MTVAQKVRGLRDAAVHEKTRLLAVGRQQAAAPFTGRREVCDELLLWLAKHPQQHVPDYPESEDDDDGDEA